MMAEHLRPRIVNSLRVPIATSTLHDHRAFILTIKRVGEVWFGTLFSHMLILGELLRVWDCVLIYGMEFILKFALVILSKNERFIRSSVRAEAKTVPGALQLDALIAAGNAVKVKLMSKIEKDSVETMIKKALAKPTYVSLTRIHFFPEAKREESSYIERLRRLRETKEQLRKTNNEMDTESIVDAFEALENIENKGLVSRDAFMIVARREFCWSEADALRFYTAFDQQGEDLVDVRELKSALAILMKGNLQDKLRGCFMAFDVDGSGDLDPEEVIEMVSIIERCLDGRSSFFKSKSESLYTSMGRNSEGKIPEDAFITAAESNPACKPVLDFIQAIELPMTDQSFIDLSQIPELTTLKAVSEEKSGTASPISDTESIVGYGKEAERMLATPVVEEVKAGDGGKRRASDRGSRQLHTETVAASIAPKQRDIDEKHRQVCARLCTRDMCILS